MEISRPETRMTSRSALVAMRRTSYRRASDVGKSSALRTENESSPEKTRCTVRPSLLIHLEGNELDSPGPTSQCSVKYTVVQGPHGCGASYTPKPPPNRASLPGSVCDHRYRR